MRKGSAELPFLHRGGYPQLSAKMPGFYYGAVSTTKTKNKMIYTIAIILLVLWLLGLVTSATMGGFIHILLVVAVVLVLASFISGRRRLN